MRRSLEKICRFRNLIKSLPLSFVRSLGLISRDGVSRGKDFENTMLGFGTIYCLFKYGFALHKVHKSLSK